MERGLAAFDLLEMRDTVTASSAHIKRRMVYLESETVENNYAGKCTYSI